MGLSVGAGMAISAGLSAATGAANMAVGGAMNQRAQHEAWRARKWQTQEREASQDWQLDMWNLTNQYNSPVEQLRRAREAGVSPMAIINGDMSMSDAQAMSAPSDPSTQVPQFQNPVAAGTSSMLQAANSFLEWQKFQVESKEASSRMFKNMSDAEKAMAETKTIDGLREGQITFQGVQIQVAESTQHLNEGKLKEIATNIVKMNQEVEQIKSYMNLMNVQADYTSWRKYCERQKLPKEVELLGVQVLVGHAQRGNLLENTRFQQQSRGARLGILNSQNTIYNVQAHQDYKYYKEGYWRKDMKNASTLRALGVEQSAGNTYSPFGYAVKRGMQITSDMLEPFTKAAHGYMMWQTGRSMQIKTIPQTSGNPIDNQPPVIPPSIYY